MKKKQQAPHVQRDRWPTIRRYEGDQLARISLPLGGIGTGTVGLGGRGQLCDWELMNRPSKGFIPQHAFFALYAKPDAGVAVTRALEGALLPQVFEGAMGSAAANHGLPRFRSCVFETAYPFGQVLLSDPEVPLDVRMEAFNPLIPADADASGIPVAVIRFVLTNKTSKRVEAAVCGSLENFIGRDGTNGKAEANINTFRRGPGAWQGIFMQSEGVAADSEFWGTLALATDAKRVTYRTAWPQLSWGNTLLDFWDDFSTDGKLDERQAPGVDAPTASLAPFVTIEPRSSQTVTFLLTWSFPNRMTWTPDLTLAPSAGTDNASCAPAPTNRVGNYYATQYTDAWDVIRKTAKKLPALEEKTLAFVRAFCDSPLPEAVKEAALFNLSTLRTQTCFRIESGEFFAWEGCNDTVGSCHGSCTHVWNYETATASLFGDLARSMREVEFLHATHDNGLMCFRVNLPLARAKECAKAAADGQLGCVMKVYRDWQLSGDTAWLKRLWPNVKKTLSFCWIPGGWDADVDGVMEGCQHNTMDVEYYGPNPQMQFWYLGALRAAEEMARHLGETAFADTCRDLFTRGSAWTDANLFNGEYYEHEIRPMASAADIAPGLRIGMGAGELSDPELQLGSGCLVDQLVGQYLAHVCGLGYLADPAKITQTLRSVMKYNFKENLYGHFNHLRTFALNDESALLMGSYPLGRRPRQPFPYYNEVMTGFEYTAATHMLFEGQIENGLKAITSIRARYDGQRRNPYDEAECGHHYGRAMASWTGVLAWSGFHYSGVTQTLTFAAQLGRHFWSSGYAWGTCNIRADKTRRKWTVTLDVLHGRIKVKTLCLIHVGEGTKKQGGTTLKPGTPTVFTITANGVSE